MSRRDSIYLRFATGKSNSASLRRLGRPTEYLGDLPNPPGDQGDTPTPIYVEPPGEGISGPDTLDSFPGVYSLL